MAISKVLLLAPLLLLLGCGPKNVTATAPTQGGDAYTYCLKAADDIAVSVNSGMTLVDRTRQNGLLTVNEETTILGYLKFANDADVAFVSCIQTAHAGGGAAGTFTSCANTLNSAVNNPQEMMLVRANNLNAQSTINTIVQGIISAVDAVTVGLGGK